MNSENRRPDPISSLDPSRIPRTRHYVAVDATLSVYGRLMERGKPVLRITMQANPRYENRTI